MSLLKYKSPLTVNEIVQVLKHSQLPTVITEGTDDYTIYQKLEHFNNDASISFFPVGGKEMLLEVFRRRKEFSSLNVIFVADQDWWLFTGIPPEYQSKQIIFTNGYSIENDAFRDGDLIDLMSREEQAQFQHELVQMSLWLAFAIDKTVQGHEVNLAVHPNQALIAGGKSLCPNFCASENYEVGPASLYSTILTDYAKAMRGKTLIQLALRQLSSAKRAAKYSRLTLLEIGASRKGPILSEISQKIRDLIEVKAESKL